jgi:regulation of enolase protein 1 (concanavalin A-like superfamily)
MLAEEFHAMKGGISTMRKLLLVCLLAAPAFAQSGNLGAFTNSGDVGGPSRKGSTEFNAAKGEYRITGSGANIWAKEDQFQYVWREMPGNFTVTATMQFLGQGEEHRKAGIMVRQSLDADSAYGDFLIHGSGMPGLQWRSAKGENTNTFDLPFDGPGKFRLKLVRSGVGITVSIAKEGAELKEIARTEVTFRNPVFVGLVVCAHNADKSDTVVFSDVSVESTVPPGSH